MDASNERRLHGSDDAGASPLGAPVEFVVALDALAKLFAVASVYAPDHERIIALSGAAVDALRSACAARKALVVELRDGTFVAEGHALPGRTTPVRRLYEELDALGVTRLEVGREATAADLLTFGRALRARPPRAPGATVFEHAAIEGLPGSIRLEQQDFGAPTFDENEALRLAGGGLEDKKLTEQEIASIVEHAVGNTLGGLPEPEELPEGARAPETRKETVRAIAEAIRRVVEKHLQGAHRRQSVAAILEDAERLLPRLALGIEAAPILKALRTALNVHLRDRFRRESRATYDARSTHARESEAHELSLRELQSSITEFTSAGDTFGDPNPVDPAEYLGILLHLLRDPPSPALVAAIGARIQASLGKPLDPSERAVLAGWLHDLCEREAPATVDKVLPLVIVPLRTVGSGSVVDALLSALRPPRSRTLAALWPHLVNEMLLGVDDSARSLESETAAVLAEIAPNDLREAGRRLAALPGAQTPEPSKRLFLPPRQEFYPLYAAFLELRETPRLGAEVLEAFRRSTPPSAALGALLALRDADDRARSVLVRFLNERDTPGDSVGLRKLAADVAVGALRALPRRRRREPWVAPAITALRSLRSADSEALVQEVGSARRLRFLRDWPLAARHAAAAVEAAYRAERAVGFRGARVAS